MKVAGKNRGGDTYDKLVKPIRGQYKRRNRKPSSKIAQRADFAINRIDEKRRRGASPNRGL